MKYPVGKSNLLFFIIILIFTTAVTYSNYLLFHSYVEGISIIIAGIVFVITWNSERYIKNNFLLIVGISYLFIAHLDFLHILGYKGMNIFKDYDFYANQLWIASRFLESSSLLAGALLINKKKRVNPVSVFIIMFLYSLVSILSIFQFKIFPECFIENLGQTKFKIYSEYIIISFLIISVFFLVKNKKVFSKKLFLFLISSIVLTIFSELFFTIYISNYGISNIVGHYFKIFSFLFIYLSIVETALQEPYKIIFRDLNESNTKLEKLYEGRKKVFRVISHDLKTPFNGLIGFSEYLHTDFDRLSRKDLREITDNIYLVSKESFNFLENLLDWLKLDESEWSPEFIDFDLVKRTKDIFDMYSLIAETKNINITFESDLPLAYINADKKMISAVIRNIISNALKFTPEEGNITIHIKEDEDYILLEIRDSGVGMSKEQQNKLFTSKKDIKNGTNDELSNGIGTTIIKEFCNKMNINIDVESELHQGTSFMLKIKKASD